MSKNNDKAKSIDLGNESEEEKDETKVDVDKRSYWNTDQKCRDHAMQMVLLLSANLGIDINGVFKVGVFADKNINGLRTFLSHKDDPKNREIMIYASKSNVMKKFIVPCFLKSEGDNEVLVPLMKLFLSLTRGLTKEKRPAIVTRVKEKKQGRETKAECLVRVKAERAEQLNAYEQINALMRFKEAIVTEEIFDLIYDYVAFAIEKTPKERTTDDIKSIETVLFLLSNLLQIQAGPFSLSSEKIHSRSLQNKLILILQKKNFLFLLLLLCTSISAVGNKQWSGLIMELLHYIFWDRDMKDLAYSISHKNQSSVEYQVQRNLQKRQENAGKLSNQLLKDRKLREAAAQNPDQCFHRLGGMIRVPPKAQSSQGSQSADPKDKKSNVPVFRRGLTGKVASTNKGAVGSQINSSSLGGGKKRGKTCSFADSKSTLQSITSTSDSSSSAASINVLEATLKSSVTGGMGDEEKRVNLALAEFLNEFLDEAFGELVRSMKDSWIRAEASTPRVDLLFYSFTTACLKYDRCFKLSEQRAHMVATEKAEITAPWIPDLKKITDCFDRMMITHPVDTVKKHFEAVGKDVKSTTFGDVAVPIQLYKEMISFIRIMLESEGTVHNDIAMTAMFRIFYNPNPTERLDILPLVLKNWNPRHYSKAHMFTVIELCHETLQLLDIADSYLVAEKKQVAKGSLSKKAIERLEGRDRNFGAANNFEKSEYFRRITTSTTVAMYTKALEYYRENTNQLNHHIYLYMKRMKDHVLDTDEFNEDDDSDSEEYVGLSDADKKKKQAEKKPNLGHLLFNIGTLNVFNVILNDKDSEKTTEQLLKLIKCVVRNFGLLAAKNHLLYVEILLHQPFPVKTITDIASTYDAADLAKNYRVSGKVYVKKTRGKGKSIHHNVHNNTVYSSESEADSDEFSAKAKPVSKPIHEKKKKSDLRDRIEKKRSNRPKKSRDESDDSDDDQVDLDEVTALQEDLQAPVSRGKRVSKNQWSGAEDAVLRRLYKQYAGSHSVFAMIAQDSDLVDLGGSKNSQKVEKRVQQLQLHLELADMLSSEEGGSSSESSEASSDTASENNMSVDEGDVNRVSPSLKKASGKKRKGKTEKKTKSKDKKKKSKPNSKYFISPGADKANNEDDRGPDSDEDAVEEDVSAHGTWNLGSPASDAFSHKANGSNDGGSAVKPFWEDDLEGEDDNEEGSFEQRMLALAARGSGPDTGKVKKKSLLKKVHRKPDQSEDSGSDMEIVDDDVKESGTNHSKRSSVLIDSDDDE